MSAKTLDGAITNAMCVGPLTEFKERLKKELREYMAHEIMAQEKELEDSHAWPEEHVELLCANLRVYFARIFNDIADFKRE